MSGQVEEQRGGYRGWVTSSEFASFLGLTARQFRRWRQIGKIPEPAARSEHGWGLWSPEQQSEAMRKKAGIK